MEIYKLKDEVEKGGEVSRVTDLKAGVRNPERVNVFINSRFAFSLDVAQVVDYKLKVGMILSAEKLEELRRASEFGKLYQRALEWVLMRPRSEREVRDYLLKKLRNPSSDTLKAARPSLWSSEGFSEFLETILQRLITKGYLDDRKFAEWWVENRNVRKGVSQKKLRVELMGKGVAREIIDEVLSGRDDEEEIRKMVAKKRTRYDDPEKLKAYLCRQGFSYDLVRKIVEESD